VVVTVSSRERDELVVAGTSGTASTDTDLCAGWVVLGTLEALGEVEGDDFVADKIVAGRKVIGELSPGLSTIHEVSLNPVA